MTSRADAPTRLRRRITIASNAAAARGTTATVQVPVAELEALLALIERTPEPAALPPASDQWRSPLHRTYQHDPAAHRAPAVAARLANLSAGQAQIAKSMSEDGRHGSLLVLIKGEIRRLGGLLAYHTKNAMQSSSGFPDLHILGEGPGRVMYRELKTERGWASEDQVNYLYRLNTCGFDADVWRPSDWYSQRIQRELAALAGQEYASW